MATESHHDALNDYRHSNGNSQTTQTEALDATHTDGHVKHHDDFVEAYEHMDVGYGEDRNEKADREIHAPGNPNVHEHMNIRLFLALTAMSFLWIGSQIPLYLYGSVLPDIYGEIGGANGKWVWMIIGYLIPNAALCPFVGALSDLFGRKKVAMFGQIVLMIGPILVSTATRIEVAIGGQVISGLGAGLNELIALAGTSEIVPVRKRATYVGIIVFTIIPFAPSPLWAQLITRESNWRYVGALVATWNFIGLLLLAFFYKDPVKHVRPAKEVLREVDFMGGFLSTAGVTLFMMGLQWGAREYSWQSVHTLVPFSLGLAFIIAFFVWEVFFAKYPMCPPRIFSRDKRSMICILLITFFSGGNFFVMLLFWPTEVYNLYGNDPIGIGIRTLPIGFGIIFGAFFALILIGITKGRTTALMIFWTIFMTAFTGAMVVARRNNLVPVVYPIVTLASFGVGAVIIPCSIIAQITCPTDLIGTITAITLAIRYIGGAIGFAAFYNVFFHKYYDLANTIAAPLIASAGITQDYYELLDITTMASNAQYRQLKELIAQSPTIMNKDIAYDVCINAVQEAFQYAYEWPYYISIAFGGICIICAFGLRDIRKFMMDGHDIGEHMG